MTAQLSILNTYFCPFKPHHEFASTTDFKWLSLAKSALVDTVAWKSTAHDIAKQEELNSYIFFYVVNFYKILKLVKNDF